MIVDAGRRPRIDLHAASDAVINLGSIRMNTQWTLEFIVLNLYQESR